MNKVIILAAGEGTRMKSKTSKVLHKLCNKSMLSYIVEACREAGLEEVVVIVGKNENQVRDEFGDTIKYIRQEIGEGIPYGTGYAVKLAEDLIEDEDRVFVLTGDIPLIRANTLKETLEYHNQMQNDATVISAIFDDPSGYGRIVLDENSKLVKIVEHKDCDSSELLIKEINSGIQVFNGDKLKYALNKLDTNNSQGELYITDVFGILREEGPSVSTFKLKDNDEIMGVNTKVQLAQVDKIMRMRINEALMLEGVIMENPETITIQKGVKIGRDTFIESNVKILGDTVIGEDCFIGMNSNIQNSKIGNGVMIRSSFIENSIVEDNCDIGPFARLRPKSHLEEKVHIGNFVEVKNSTLGKDTKAGHLAYVGDADVGERVNISCGVIFANYDGKNKHRSTVGNDAFLGSNVTLISPLEVEDKGFLAAGSTVTKKVFEGQLAIERAIQKNIDGYYKRKFNK